MCLWLMVPALMDNRVLTFLLGHFPSNKTANKWLQARTRGPHWRHGDSGFNSSPLPDYPYPEPGRDYSRHETSHSITGTFKLYDSLELSTTSGSINVNIEPQPGEKPARLTLRTKSGSIRINMGDGILPWLPSSDQTNRTFMTSLNTKSGSVTGSLVAGNGGSTLIETSSGSITVSVHMLDLGSKDSKNHLSTISSSGSQTLNILSSSTEYLSSLAARHIVHGSGSVRIDYPRRWTGFVKMISQGSGSLNVAGSGLHYVVDERKQKIAWREPKVEKPNDVEIILQGSGSGSFVC
jgi:hypothetical protein